MSTVRKIGVVGTTLAGMTAAAYGQHMLVARTSTDLATWLLICGCAAAALAIAAGRRPVPIRPDASRAVEAVVVGFLLLLGVWLRVAAFDRIPEGINHDAAWNGMYATAIRLGADFTPYVAAAWGRETLFMYLIAPFQLWLGSSAAAVQAASVLAGVAGLVPLYLLARELFGRFAAVAALGFFSVSGWHWVFSQVGWRCVTVPPFETFALYFLWRSFQRGRRLDWLAAGALTAACIYTYNAARIVPAMVAVLALWHLAWHRDRWRSILGGGLLAGIAFGAVGSSMLWYAANNWVKFQGRAAHLLDASQRQVGVAENLPTALWMFNFRAGGNDFFIEEPLLEPLAAVLFVLGIGLLLVRARQARAQFVLIGFLLSLVPGLLSFPNGNRCITAMPFVYVTIGYACAELARVIASLFASGAQRWVAALVLLGCLSQATVATYGAYLGENRRPLRGFSPEATAVGEYLGGFGEEYRVYAVTGAWQRYTLYYLGYTHGDPVEPDIVVGSSFAEIENQISRYGRKGLVVVTDDTAAAARAREGIKTIFADAREEPVRAARLDGAEIARAVIVEPREAARTALWSNRSRVLSVTGADGSAHGARCFVPRPTGAGLSARFRMMIPEISQTASGEVALVGACPSRDGAIRFTHSSDGLVIDGPARRVLVEPSSLQGGRWHDVGLSIDRSGNCRAMIDGEAVDLGPWPDRPVQLTGISVTLASEPGEAAQLYVDDFATIPKSVPADRPWWQVAPRRGDSSTQLETFEGLPLGDLSMRPGWNIAEGRWEILSGPGGEGGAVVAASNGFDGGQGRSPGEFHEPMGVGIDADGNIYVSERLNHRVQKFAADGSYLGEWGVHGSAPGEFREPLDLSVDGDRVYVMDTWNTRLQVFDLTGNYLFQIGPDPAIGKPRGIFVRDGKIYMANSGRDNILVYDAEGKEQAKFPAPQTSTLKQVVDLVADSRGRVYVNNSQLGRLEMFSGEGERLGAIEIPGWESPVLREFYMAIDDDDVIYISDWQAQRVRRFGVDGVELPPIGPKMNRPSGLAVRGDRVVVAARGENRLRSIDVPAVGK